MINLSKKKYYLHTVPLNWLHFSATNKLHPWVQNIILGDVMIESLSVILRN